MSRRRFVSAACAAAAFGVFALTLTMTAHDSHAGPSVNAAAAVVAPRAVSHESGAIPQSPAMSKEVADKFGRVESELIQIPSAPGKPPVTFSLTDTMANFKDPALSLAIIDNFEIVAVKAYGFVTSGEPALATTKTLFQAGSISKPVAAAGALAMVEKGQLQLDTNVNDALKSWKVPDNKFTETEKVTLRRLLSHTAGTNVSGFPGYEVGAPLPTVVQVLNGEKPANTAPVRVVMTPGTKQEYSGGGITIEQLLVSDVSGKPFAELMRELVFDKVGMKDSFYEQPPSEAEVARVATGTFTNGHSVAGRYHVYPEMAAAGLWTTPTDLALYAIEIAKSRNGKSNKILTEKMTEEMLTPIVGEGGLGFYLNTKNPGMFLHGGADEGFQSLMIMNYQTGKGAVVMTNSDNGIRVATATMRAVAREFGWNYKTLDDTMTEIFLLDLASGPKAALARYDEIKRAPTAERNVDEATLNLAGYAVMNQGRTNDAIAIFQRNTVEYPKSFNVWDSLGEAYMRNGEKDLAVQNYEKSLAIEPRNTNATDMLKRMGASDKK